jgi:hypothetical protein
LSWSLSRAVAGGINQYLINISFKAQHFGYQQQPCTAPSN